jgi:hypothetical protein
MLMFNRENLSLERQRLADRARYMMEGMKLSQSEYINAIDNYEKQRRQDIIAAKLDPDDPKEQAKYEQVNPKPSADEFRDNWLRRNFGITSEEAHRVIQEGLDVVPQAKQGAGGAGTDAAAGAQSPPGASSTLDERARRVVSQLSVSRNPDVDATSLASHVIDGHVDPYQAKFIFSELRRSVPAALYLKLRDAYNKRVQSGPTDASAWVIPE